MSRKKVQIDWQLVNEMLEAHNSGADIARHLGIHPVTLYERCRKDNKTTFEDLLHKCRAQSMHKLRCAQIECALGTTYVNEHGKTVTVLPNVEMLKFLGKQYLGQTDKVESKHTISGYIIEDEDGKVIEDTTTLELQDDNED